MVRSRNLVKFWIKYLYPQMMSTTSVRVHNLQPVQKRARKSRARPIQRWIYNKSYAVVDPLSLPIQLMLPTGQNHDSVTSVKMMSNFFSTFILSDKAYDISEFPSQCTKDRAEAGTPLWEIETMQTNCDSVWPSSHLHITSQLKKGELIDNSYNP